MTVQDQQPPASEKPTIPFILKEKLALLQQQLEEQNPGFGTILSQIHALTKENPEFVYGLSDEECCTIFQGYSKYTGVTIAAKEEKKTITKKEGAMMNEDSV